MSLPLIKTADKEAVAQHVKGKYYIYCDDPYYYQPVLIEEVEELAEELEAVNPKILLSRGERGCSMYLVADSFEKIQPEIEKAFKVRSVQSFPNEDGTYTHLIGIDHFLFHGSYPLEFFKEEDREESDGFGEIIFYDASGIYEPVTLE